ncbi:hypothetical protein L7F22_054242 [Adiantum nelumboides]|nr:hypothetical protein [Adiantum nelumboides]
MMVSMNGCKLDAILDRRVFSTAVGDLILLMSILKYGGVGDAWSGGEELQLRESTSGSIRLLVLVSRLNSLFHLVLVGASLLRLQSHGGSPGLSGGTRSFI